MRRGNLIWTIAALLVIIFAIPPGDVVSAQIDPPEFSKHALLNGLEVLFLPQSEDKVNFALMVRNGAAFDPVGKWGVTRLTAEMTLDGSDRRTGPQLREDLDAVGATLAVRVGWDAIYYLGTAPGDRVEDVLNILGEMIVHPAFEEEGFERLRAGLIEKVKSAVESRELRSQQVFRERLFQENPYAHTVEGTVETLQALQLNDVRIQYRRLFMPNQAQLALTFSGDRARLFRAIGRSWGSWVRGEAAPFTFRQAKRPEGTRILLLNDGKSPGLMRLGTLASRRGEQDYYVLKVLQHYLTLSLTEVADQAASSSQVQASVRLETGRMPGYLQLSVRAPSDQLAGYFSQVKKLLAAMQEGQLNPLRFQEAKELALLELRSRLEAPETRLQEILEANLYELGISYLTNYGLRLDRVKPARFREAITRLLPLESCLIVVAGNSTELAPGLGSLGQLEILN